MVSVPASAFPLTLLALMGFKDPIGGQLQVQSETVQWGVRKLGLQISDSLVGSECFKLLVDRCVWMLFGREVGCENLMTSFLKWQCCCMWIQLENFSLKHLDKIEAKDHVFGGSNNSGVLGLSSYISDVKLEALEPQIRGSQASH